MRNIIMKNNRCFYKGLLLSVFILCFLTGCSAAAKTSTYDVEREITGEEKDELLGTVYDRIYEQVERGNEQEEPTLLTGIYTGGKDATVPEGRYVISGSQGGLITILDEDGNVWLKEALFGGSIVVSLLDTDTVHADAGFDEFVSITKAEELDEPLLTTGIWEVGIDIDPGTYKFFSEGGHGFIQVFEKGASPRVYEIIGGLMYEQVGEKFEIIDTGIYKKITIEEGQKIRVTGVAARFEEFED